MTTRSIQQATRDPFSTRTPPLWPHIALGAFLILWLDAGTATSALSATSPIVKFGAVALWTALAAARSAPFLTDFVKTNALLAVMAFVILLYSEKIEGSGQYLQGIAYLGVAFSLFCFYGRPQYERERNILLLVLVIDLAITGFRTLIALQANPLVSRYLATTPEIRFEIYGEENFDGLGGYAFAYALASILLLLLFFVTRSKRKALILIVLALGSLLLIDMAFATAILLTAVLGGAFLIRDLIPQTWVKALAFAVLLLGWASGLYTYMLRSAANLASLTPEVQVRLVELAQFLDGNPLPGSDLASRFALWDTSILTLLASGPLGLAGTVTADSAIGGHSQWLDLLAAYGLYSIILVMYFILAWRATTALLDSTALAAVRRAWLLLLLIGLVNTVLFSVIVLVWMFLVPSLAAWLSSRLDASKAGAS